MKRVREAFERLRHLRETTDPKMRRDADILAAIERYLEIISEGSRHVPEELKASAPQIPWRRIADIGNILRHAYHAINPDILWAIVDDELDELCEHLRPILAPERGGADSP